jgi:6-phosphogluconolactonase
MAEVRTFASLDDAADALARALAAAVEEGVAARGLASLALSGGRTPVRVLSRLAGRPLPWSRVVATLTDERWVEPGHPESNEGLVRRLLGPTGLRLVGLKTPAPTPAAGLAAAAERLAAVPRPFDAVYLGFGEDGHVASLFPGDEGWRTAAAPCVTGLAPTPPRPRLSLTPAVLLDARRLFVLFEGAAKRAVFARALEPGPAAELPLRLVLHQSRVPVTVFAAG